MKRAKVTRDQLEALLERVKTEIISNPLDIFNIVRQSVQELKNSTVKKIPKASEKSKEGLRYETMESMPDLK